MSTSHMSVRLREADRCSICLSIKLEPVTLPCGHEVCRKCFHDIEQLSNLTCPFCRKRLSVWSRRSSRLKQLVNEQRWQEIQSLYPDIIERILAAKAAAADANDDSDKENQQSNTNQEQGDDEVAYDMQCDQIVRDMAAPGEIRKEFEQEMEREAMIRRREREKEEEISLSFIRTNFGEDTERITRQKKMERDDAALARLLQRQMDQEEEQMKRGTKQTDKRRTRRESHTTPTPDSDAGSSKNEGDQVSQCKRRRTKAMTPVPVKVELVTTDDISASAKDVQQDLQMPIVIEHSYSKIEHTH